MNATPRALAFLHKSVLLDGLALQRWIDEHWFALSLEDRVRALHDLGRVTHVIEHWWDDLPQEMGRCDGDIGGRMMRRIIEVNGKLRIQRKAFRLFWVDCYGISAFGFFWPTDIDTRDEAERILKGAA